MFFVASTELTGGVGPGRDRHAFRVGDDRTVCGQPLLALWQSNDAGFLPFLETSCAECIDLVVLVAAPALTMLGRPTGPAERPCPGAPRPSPRHHRDDVHRAETVLVIEDEEALRDYAQPVLASQGSLEPEAVLLKEPFSEASMLRKIREVLDA